MRLIFIKLNETNEYWFKYQVDFEIPIEKDEAVHLGSKL